MELSGHTALITGAGHGVSQARQQYENLLEASFGVWTRGAINKRL